MTINLENNYEIIPESYDQSQVKIGMRESLKIDLLPICAFLEHLRREERLADRSKTALSIVIFRFSDKKSNELDDIRMVLRLLKNSIRETDILGYLDENVIGILLPATDEKGAQEFKKRIINRYTNPTFSTITGTYPDKIFNNLLTENLDQQSDFYPFFLDDPIESNQWKYVLKRGSDIIGAFVGILLLSPLMLITALAIKATSPGPVIFKQTRVGKNGVPFTFYKFRSMFWNADDKIHREYVAHLIHGDLKKINQGDNERPFYKIKSDPRVTRVGKIIRKTSIDELPQLFNVLKGEMSLVGPRPPLSYEVEKYQSWHLRRVLQVKPGITGLWQVEGRSEISFDEMVRLDLKYIRNFSLWLDIKLLIKTFKVVFRRLGAC